MAQFSDIVQELHDQQFSYSPTVLSTLSKSRDILNQLESLLEVKVLIQVNGSSRVSRRAWARYRSKVHNIQSSIAEYRANLTIALVANSSSVFVCYRLLVGLLKFARASTARAEAMLTSINDKVNVVSSILRSIPFTSGSPMLLQPATSLETSPHFYPEIYTLESQVPTSCLTVIAAWEQAVLAKAVTNTYKVLYMRSPRHWLWLTISIEITCTSIYWPIAKTCRGTYRKWQNPSLSKAASLPYSLGAKIQGYLERCLGVQDDTDLTLSLSNDDMSLQKAKGDPKTTLPAAGDTLSPSSEVLNALHDWQCRRFVESQITQLELIEAPNCFASSVNGILVYEVKCGENHPSPEFLYNIQALHCMDGALGFTKLVGVVTDDEGKYLKSYLLEFPKARWNLFHLAGTPSIPWERREKWAFQLIQALSQLHKKGFVAGGITIWAAPLVVESTDSVQFSYLKQRVVAGRTVGAYYPPEFRYVRDMSPTADAADSPLATSKMDIFHLGLMLWLLAENKPTLRASPVCMRMKCDWANDSSCDLSHAEPVTLPQLPTSIPQYFRDMIDDCRAGSPSSRPAAWELLRRFPAASDRLHQPELSVPQKTPQWPGSGTLETGLRMSRVACCICKLRPVPLPLFHCKVCDMDNFDLCQACFEAGRHCYNMDHYLVELEERVAWSFLGSIIPPSRVRAFGTLLSFEHQVVTRSRWQIGKG